MMPAQRHLKIDEATTRKEIVDFLADMVNSDQSGGKLHLRAKEKTRLNKDGTSTTVTKLFVRSRTNNPFKWFKNIFNRDRDYTLAAKVLRTRLQYQVSLPNDKKEEEEEPPTLSNSCMVLMGVGLKYREKGVSLSTVAEAFPYPLTRSSAPIN